MEQIKAKVFLGLMARACFLFLVISCTKKPDISELVIRSYNNIKVENSINLFNEQRARYYDSLSRTNVSEPLLYVGKKGYELLNAGKTKEAITTLLVLIDSLERKGSAYQKYIPGVKQVLALGYMRLGEQENCILNHSSSSCIVPIGEQGFHTLEEGSTKAIKIYEDLVSTDPYDYSSRWLMNIAYMTLGKYPQEVPKEWLIPSEAFESDEDIAHFRDVAASAGVDALGLAGGACVDDFNNDGLLDVICSFWGQNGKLHYFQNNGDGSFTDQTSSSGLLKVPGGLNIVHADYDNNGYADILVLRGAWFSPDGRIPNSLLRNNGDGTFTDVTYESGILAFNSSQTATWGDINNDGWIDLFIGTESDFSSIQNCELYLNNGDGTFTDITVKAGLNAQLIGWVKGCAFGDINNDGWQDLYISFYNKKNKLFLNQGGSEIQEDRFQDISTSAGITNPQRSFPTWFWDYNNDGWQDIFVSGYPVGTGVASIMIVAANYMGIKRGGYPRIYKNKGDNTFEDVSRQLGIDDAIFTMGCNFGDLDNDGYEDFYLGTGDPDLMSVYPNRMFRNDGARKFLDVTSSGGFGNIQKGHGVGFGDFDNDGDQDIYMVMGGSHDGDIYQNALFENPIGNKNNWITIKLLGTTSNRLAIGARIKVVAEKEDGLKRVYHRVVTSGGSFGGSSLQVELGLLDAISISELEVIWPNDQLTTEFFEDIPVNKKIEIIEGEKMWREVESTTFSFKTEDEQHEHQENRMDN